MSAPTVNPTLTPQGHSRRRPHPRRPVVENDDYAAFVRRIVAAHGRRIAHGDIEGLANLATLTDDVTDALHRAVTGCRDAGFSWAEIADRLGTTRQAAHQRFGKDTP